MRHHYSLFCAGLRITGRIPTGCRATLAGGGVGDLGAGSQGRGPRRWRGLREPRHRASGSCYLARLGGGRQARVSPVVAPYGHHAGADFVAQFQGEHGQQHDGGGSGEDGSRPEAGTAEPASPAAVRGAGTRPTWLQRPQAGSKTARDRDAPPRRPLATAAAAQTRPAVSDAARWRLPLGPD